MQTFTTLAALAAALLVTPAVGQDRAGPQSQRVAHADLDLREAGDVRRLDLRIARTARALCGEASLLDVVGQRKARHCADAAVARVANARSVAISIAKEITLAAN